MRHPSHLGTIPAMLAATVARREARPALGVIREGSLAWHTWRQVAEDADRLADAIRAAGVAPGDRVAQVSENSYEWIITDLAIHLAGAVHVPIHVTLSGEQIAEQIADCGARLVVVSREGLSAKFRGFLADDVRIVVHDEQDKGAGGALLGKPAVAPNSVNHRTTPVAPDDLATILYTSGTTGRPRGVMLSQLNLAGTAAATAEAHGSSSDQVRLNILPFSHIYARTCDLYTWVFRGSRLVLAEGRETLTRDCQLVKPTTISAVPYVYERIADRVRTGDAADEATALRAVFGGRIERLTCGGATLAPETEAWYAERGLPVLCGYGLTEGSPVVTSSTRAAHRPGSVGRPIPGVEVRIADDGEILVRSPGVMLGYWQDAAATAEAIRDGWLHTGDLGEMDGDGFLALRGRKKELIALSTGKKVSPARVENLLTASPLIEQAVVFGEGQPALVAIVVPACGLASDRPTTRRELTDEIHRRLASAAREEQVRDFVIADRPLSIERGELTVKSSLCRATIAQNFAAELAAMDDKSNTARASRARRLSV